MSVSKEYTKELEKAAKLREELKLVEERTKSLQREHAASQRKEEKARKARYATALGKEICELFYDADPVQVAERLKLLKEGGQL